MPFQLLPGDCVESLRTMKSASIDSVVTDPPYGMSEADPDLLPIFRAWFKGEKYEHKTAGFMGRQWDAFVPGPEIWKEVYRVMKPGAFLAAFCSTRTWDVMSIAIRLAGFECRDTIAHFGPSALAWTQGCLSKNTEILLDGKWEPYHKAKVGRKALCFDVETQQLHWEPIQAVFEYDYDNIAYHIKGEQTDQLVSRTHRCLVYLNGQYDVRLAEQLPQQIEVPILQQTLFAVSAPLSGKNQRGQDLFKSLPQTMADQNANQTPRNAKNGDQNVCDLCKANVSATSMASQISQGNILFSAMRGSTAGRRLQEARTQGPRRVDGSIADFIQTENEWGQESSMEGRGDILQNAGELQGGKICAMSGAPDDNVAQGRVCHGTPSSCGASTREAVVTHRGSTSHKPQPNGQYLSQPCVVCHQSRSQEVRTYGEPTPTLARVTPVHYQGKVWCVRVPPSFFVVRRNGQVFITGNSGFPKSGDVGKQLDKRNGVQRKVVGYEGKFGGGRNGSTIFAGGHFAEQGNPKPVLEETENEFNGFSQTLKPSWEVILIFRKPFEGTMLDNMQQWGTGAMNIGAARVGNDARENQPGSATSLFQAERYNGTGEDKKPRSSEKTNQSPFPMNRDKGVEKTTISSPVTGRWPANIVFTHQITPIMTLKGNLPDAIIDKIRRYFNELYLRTSSSYGGSSEPTRREGNCAPQEREEGGQSSGKSDSNGLGGALTQVPQSRMGISRSTSESTTTSKRTPMFEVLATNIPPEWESYFEATGKFATCEQKSTATNEITWHCLEGCPVQALGEQSGSSKSRASEANYDVGQASVESRNPTRIFEKTIKTGAHYGDAGTASRYFSNFAADAEQPFFYEPKVQEKDRNYGAEHLFWARDPSRESGCRQVNQKTFERLKPSQRLRGNIHVTVKPTALGVWLAKLLCPPGGIVLDPFCGSGSLGVGAIRAGMRFVGCELDPDHCKVAAARLQKAEIDATKNAQSASAKEAPPTTEKK